MTGKKMKRFGNKSAINKRAMSIPTSLDVDRKGAPYNLPDPSNRHLNLLSDRKGKKPNLLFGILNESNNLPIPDIDLYDIHLQSQDQINKYVKFVRRNIRVYRVLFKKYAAGPLRAPVNPLQASFEKYQILKSAMNLGAVNRMLSDLQITRQDFKR